MSNIIKWFLPSDKKLAKMAAEQIQKAVNRTDREEQIAKYSQMAD